MAFTGSAPSTNILNGNSELGSTYVGGSTTAPKATTKKTTDTTKTQPPTATHGIDTPQYDQYATNKPVTVVPVPPSNYNINTQGIDPITAFWIPLVIVLIVFAVAFKLMIGYTHQHPVYGYAHRHKRVGGPSHNTPGRMQPRVLPSHHRH